MSDLIKPFASFLATFCACCGLVQPLLAANPRSQGALGVSLAEAKHGVRVIAVVPGSPAEKAGILPGDEIVRIGNQTVQSIRNFIENVRKMTPGAAVDLGVTRNGEQHVMKAQLATVESVFGPRQQASRGPVVGPTSAPFP